MTATQTFTCNICGEESTRICARCTKDTCNNHLCEKCLHCSDCCECEIVRDESVRPVVRPHAQEPTLEAPPEVAVEGAPVPEETPEETMEAPEAEGLPDTPVIEDFPQVPEAEPPVPEAATEVPPVEAEPASEPAVDTVPPAVPETGNDDPVV
jgi:hypothetical protein